MKPIADINASAERSAYGGTLLGISVQVFRESRYSQFLGSQSVSAGEFSGTHAEPEVDASWKGRTGRRQVLKPFTIGACDAGTHILLHRPPPLPGRGAKLLALCYCRGWWLGNGHARGP